MIILLDLTLLYRLRHWSRFNRGILCVSINCRILVHRSHNKCFRNMNQVVYQGCYARGIISIIIIKDCTISFFLTYFIVKLFGHKFHVRNIILFYKCGTILLETKACFSVKEKLLILIVLYYNNIMRDLDCIDIRHASLLNNKCNHP